jgi:hypothetical protein
LPYKAILLLEGWEYFLVKSLEFSSGQLWNGFRIATAFKTIRSISGIMSLGAVSGDMLSTEEKAPLHFVVHYSSPILNFSIRIMQIS